MDKYKYLLKNIGLLTISSFGSKILSFILIPLYTSVLTTEEYGIYDLLNNMIILMIPFLTLSINEAVMRFSIEKERNKSDILTIGLNCCIVSSFFVLFLILLNAKIKIIDSINLFAVPFLLMYILNSFLGVITGFARGLEKVKEISIAGFLATAVLLVSNIVFLIVFQCGILGYFYANILSVFVQILYLGINLKCWRFYKSRNVNRQLSGEMKKYSIPLIANNVSWWVNSVSDRYVVTFFLGVSVNGIYSVSTKIPTVLNIIQSIFSQAWTLSAIKELDHNEDGFIDKMYTLYNAVMVLACSALILGDKFLASLLYANEFYTAWKYVPCLLIAAVFGALSGYIGGLFTAAKNSKVFAQSTAIGAGVNIVLNIILVPLTGAMGAAVATAISYFCVWVIRMILVNHIMNIKLFCKRDFIAYGVLTIEAVVINVMNPPGILYSILGVGFAALCWFYRDTLAVMAKVLHKFIRRKRKKI